MPTLTPSPSGFQFRVTKNTKTPPGAGASILPLVVIGYCSNTTDAPVATPVPVATPDAVVSAGGTGPAVELAACALDDNGQVDLVHLVNSGATNAATYGAITQTWAHASPPVAAADSVLLPKDDFDVAILWTAGGYAVGAAGNKYRVSLDNGLHYFAEQALGTATSITFPNGAGKISLDPPTNVLVAIATELRADRLAHYADGTAHNSADATAAALITLGVPTTNAEAMAVINQVRLGDISHYANDTAHDSPDFINEITLAAAATLQEARLLAIHLKTKANLHNAATHAADATALLTATATTVGVQTYSDGSGLIAGGITTLDAAPGKITFTTAGGTPADAPATVVISGTNAATDTADTETVNVGQTATTVTSTKYWYGTDLEITYAAGDGTDATVSIGIADRVHNSADVTNTISAADPAAGTITTNDTVALSTNSPTPDATELVAAIDSLRAYTGQLGTIAFASPLPSGYIAAVYAALKELWTYNKFADVVASFDRPTLTETTTAYATRLEALDGTVAVDFRMCSGATYHQSALILTADGAATPRRPTSWAVAMAKATSEPQTDLQKVPLRGVRIRNTRGTAVLPGCLDEQSGSLYSVNARTIGTRTEPTDGGVYVTQDLVLYDSNSDWVLGPYTSVVNHALRTGAPVVRLASSAPDGFPGFDQEVIDALVADVLAVVNPEIVGKRRAKEVRFSITDTSGGKLKWKLVVVPNDYVINGVELEASVLLTREV